MPNCNSNQDFVVKTLCFESSYMQYVLYYVSMIDDICACDMQMFC